MNNFINVPIVVYTHSDYEFIWKAIFSLLKKYSNNIDIHIFINDNNPYDLNNYYDLYNLKIHYYNDTLCWTYRVGKCLNEINDEYLLFIHEDWLPINDISKNILSTMANFMKSMNSGYLLSYSHISITSKYDGIFTGYEDYYYYPESAHIFQPAIWNTRIFKEFCDNLKKNKNQNEDIDCLNFMSNKNCYSVQNIKTVTSLRTTNSLMFPHMHALSEGLWNFKKYPTLKKFLEEFGIETNTRGVHTWWELDTQ